MPTYVVMVELTGFQLPEIVAQTPEAGKKRKLSEDIETVDLVNDVSDDGIMVNRNPHEGFDHPLTVLLKEGLSLKDLVVVDPPKNRAGRKVKPAIKKLTLLCVHSTTGKQYWRCIAPKCQQVNSGNRQLSRILSHAMGCPYLSPELKSFANDEAIDKNALGTKVNPTQIQADAEDQGAPHKKARTVRNALADIVVTTGKAKYQDTVNLAIVKLFAVNGIPPSILDSPQWKNFVEVATNSKFNPPSSTMVTEKLIPAEAALVRKLQSDFLKTCVNLTITFDGGSTRKPHSVYTIHITTAERETFFMEGCDATDEHHTAEYIEGLATKVSNACEISSRCSSLTHTWSLYLQVIEAIGPHRFVAMCSDNTGNTRKARQNLANAFPTIMNLADVCHHLSNTAKDISKLPEFHKVQQRGQYPAIHECNTILHVLGPFNHEKSHYLFFALHTQCK